MMKDDKVWLVGRLLLGVFLVFWLAGMATLPFILIWSALK